MARFRLQDSEKYLNSIYSEFKQDILYPKFNIQLLKEKYSLKKKAFEKLRDKVICEAINEPGIDELHKNVKNIDMRFILDTGWGTYSIYKRRNGSEKKNYGTYASINIARFVRNKLIEADWNEREARWLKKMYGTNKSLAYISNRPKSDLMKLLDENYTTEEIMSILNLTREEFETLEHLISYEKGKNLK